MAKRIRTVLYIVVFAVTVPLVLFGLLEAYTLFSGNIHSLPGGEAYRSAQLSRSQLNRITDEHHIRSILNLRGGNYDKSWYQEEVIFAREQHIVHIDYPLTAKRPITDEQATKLIELMQHAPKPMLIHCEHGSDRTGFVSALYVKYILGQSTQEASHQLSLRFAHVSHNGLKIHPMDASFERITNNPEFATSKK